MYKLLSLTGLGLLTACLVLATPSPSHAQYYPYGGGGAYPGYGYTSGYGAFAPGYAPGYGTCSPGIGIYTPGFGLSISGFPAYGGYNGWSGGYSPRSNYGYGSYGYGYGHHWGHHHGWRR
jgi:hypothetical protein